MLKKDLEVEGVAEARANTLKRVGSRGLEGAGILRGSRERTERRSPGLGLSWNAPGLEGRENQRLVWVTGAWA